MVVTESESTAVRPRTVSVPASISTSNTRPLKTLTKIVLVQFRNGEAVNKHPELRPFVEAGWKIQSAVPRVVESEGTKLLVVLAKPEARAHLASMA
jgi:hypothetical protein